MNFLGIKLTHWKLSMVYDEDNDNDSGQEKEEEEKTRDFFSTKASLACALRNMACNEYHQGAFVICHLHVAICILHLASNNFSRAQHTNIFYSSGQKVNIYTS